ncbi:hypothetical protein HN51_062597, partial [Arachis hypogaea]
ALSIVFVSILAVQKASDISPLSFTGMLEPVVDALFMNIYIVRLNQLSNTEIDKVVESHVDSTLIPDRAPLSAYQYFKNVRNFLVAVQLYKRMIWLQN